MIITVDGQAGVGKAAAARLLASRLDVNCLDSGLFYRTVAYRMRTEGFWAAMSVERLLQYCRGIELGLDPQHPTVTVAERAVPLLELNHSRVADLAGLIARTQLVREAVVALERHAAAACEELVVVGRDSGSVVFPDARFRFVLVADLEVRVKRRYEQLVAAGEKVSLEAVREGFNERDSSDGNYWRSLATLPGTVWMNVSQMALGQLVQEMYEAVVGFDSGGWI